MSFLDGFMILKNDSLLKGITVESKMFDILERQKSALRPYSLEEVKRIITKARVNAENKGMKIREQDKPSKDEVPFFNYRQQGRVILSLEEADTDSSSFMPGVESDKTIGREVKNPRGKINNDIIMSGLWQIKSSIPNELFRRLQTIFTKGSTVAPAKRKMTDAEAVFDKFIKRVENNDKISETLQNSMYDNKLLGSKFLLVLDDMVTTGAKRMHYDIYIKLVEPTEEGFKGTDLYESVVSKIEILSGSKRLDRKALDREYKQLSSGRKLTVPKIVNLINQGRYRYQGNTSRMHLDTLSKEITDTIDDNWKDLIVDFKEEMQELNEETDEVTDKILWTSSKVESNIDYEYSQLTDNEISREQFAGDKYKSMVRDIEFTFKKLKDYFNAYKTLIGLLNEKGLSNISIDEKNSRENQVKEEYRNIMNEIKDYRNYKRQINEELAKEKEALKQFKEWQKQRMMAQDAKESVVSEEKPDKQVPLRVDSDIEALRARVKELQDKRDKQ